MTNPNHTNIHTVEQALRAAGWNTTGLNGVLETSKFRGLTSPRGVRQTPIAFIEPKTDEDGKTWVAVHSQIGTYGGNLTHQFDDLEQALNGVLNMSVFS